MCEKEEEKDITLESKVKSEKEIENEMILETLKFLIENIKGMSNGRPFDVLDYYKITSIPLAKILNYTSMLNAEDNRLFCSTMTPNKFCKSVSIYEKELTESGIEQILNLKDEVNCSKDSNGFPISGTGKEISRKEKEMLFEYLCVNKYPVSTLTYDAVRKRYINNYLHFDKENLPKR